MSGGCIDRKFEQMLYAWELDILGPEDRQRLEAHLLDCDSCFMKVTEFEKASLHLSRDRVVRQTVLEEGEREIAVEKTGTPRQSRLLRKPALVAAVSLVLLLIILKPWQVSFDPTDELVASAPRLAVLFFDNVVEPDDPDQLGLILTSLLTADLGESRFINVVSSQRLYDVAATIDSDSISSAYRESANRIAEAVRAKWMVTGEILRVEPTLEVTCQVVEVGTGSIVASVRVSGVPGSNVFSVVDQLTARIKNRMDLPPAALDEVDRDVTEVTSSSPEAYRYYLSGVENTIRVYNTRAREDFHRAIEIDSTMAMAYYHLVRLGETALVSKAVRYIDHCGQRDRYLIRHQESLVLGDTAQARAWMLEAMDRFPDERQFLEMLGFYDFFWGRNIEEAIRSYERTIEIDPGFRVGYNMLAYSYLIIGDTAGALDAADKYISSAPDEPNPYDTQGEVRANSGDLDGAIESFRESLSKDSTYITSLRNLIAMLIFREDFDEAVLQLSRLSGSDRPAAVSEAFELEALMSGRRGSFQEALAKLNQGIEFDVQNDIRGSRSYKQWLKVVIFDHLGLTDSALNNIETMTIRFDSLAGPGRLWYDQHSAQVHARAGNFDAAMQEASALENRFGRTAADGLYGYSYAMGCVELARNNPSVAVSHFETVDSLKRTYFSEYLLARALIASGRYQAGAKILEGLARSFTVIRLAYSTWDVTGHYYLGLAYEGLGRRREAEQEYRRFLDIWSEADYRSAEMADAAERLSRLENSP
ncbi:MAG: tetratricopeptide repeat protein [Candidatus Zixiibacteriota bacterium]|nr:MAG: tetratricopeptide repeat protein [candidate division Zixibacteria bacterium]